MYDKSAILDISNYLKKQPLLTRIITLQQFPIRNLIPNQVI